MFVSAKGGKHGQPTPKVTLAWNANTDSITIGYHLWLGFNSGQENQSIDVGSATTWTVQISPSTTYYFVVTAYDADRVDSLPSNEVSYTSL